MDMKKNHMENAAAMGFLCCDEIIDSSVWSYSETATEFMYSSLQNFPCAAAAAKPSHQQSAATTTGVMRMSYLAEVDCEDVLTFQNLVEQESEYLPAHNYLSKLRINRMLTQRLMSVRWLIQASKTLGFLPLTPVLAVNYLDRYLSHNISPTWKPWMLELLSVACLSVAAKMEEVDVPSLIDLQVDGLGHLFHSATVQRMELAVMNGLNWKLRSVTPIAFADKFVRGLQLSREAKNLLSERVSELIVGTLSEIEFLEFPASVIATACVQFALLENFPVQTDDALTDWLINQIGWRKAGDVKKCSKVVEDLVADPAGMPEAVEVAAEGESESYGGVAEEEEEEEEGKSPASPTGVLAAVVVESEMFARRKRVAPQCRDGAVKRVHCGGGR